MNNCRNCNKSLCTNEIGLYKRLVSMIETEYLCKECLAKHFNCEIKVLDDKIKQYKSMGCTLFELDDERNS